MKQKQTYTKKLTTYQFASQFLNTKASKTYSVFSQPYKSGRLHNNSHLFNKTQKFFSEHTISPDQKHSRPKALNLGYFKQHYNETKNDLQNELSEPSQNRQHDSSEDKQLKFANQYKDNLYKTIYMQTKTNFKEKKKNRILNHQKMRQLSHHQLQSYSEGKNITSTISHNREKFHQRFTERKNRIVYLHKQKTVQKTSELDIAQFPLIKRKYKIAAVSDLNKMFQKIHNDHSYESRQPVLGRMRRNVKNSPKKPPSRSPSRQDILPWDTFNDAFD